MYYIFAYICVYLCLCVYIYIYIILILLYMKEYFVQIYVYASSYTCHILWEKMCTVAVKVKTC